MQRTRARRRALACRARAFTVTDGHSAPVAKTVKVAVPHDQSKGAIDSGIRVDSFGS